MKQMNPLQFEIQRIGDPPAIDKVLSEVKRGDS